jgi:hypothetical protein
LKRLKLECHETLSNFALKIILRRYTLATSVAINANQIGIATSFIVGGFMAQSETGRG